MEDLGYSDRPPPPKTAETLALLAFNVILFDSMMTYFLNAFGIHVPVNALLIVLVFILFLESRGRALQIAIAPLVLLHLCVLSFMVGIFTLPQVGYARLLTLGAAVCAFFIGVCCANNIRNVDRFANVCLFISLAYCLVCMMALLQFFPSVFSVKYALGFRDGVQIIRPEITTDQNFQIFYFLPGILVIALPFRIKRFLLSLLCVLLSFYILTQLKTRSGILVLLGTLMLCIVAPFGSKQLGRKKVIILPVFLGLLTLIFLPLIMGFSTGLWERFTGSYHTFHGRLISIKYLFDHLLSP